MIILILSVTCRSANLHRLTLKGGRSIDYAQCPISCSMDIAPWGNNELEDVPWVWMV